MGESVNQMEKAFNQHAFHSDGFHNTGERIWNLIRLFNLREGMDATTDTLPPRFVKEPLPDGPAKGHSITEKDMQYMKQEYYNIRGWDKEGVPLHDTLKRLRIRHERIVR